MSVQSKKRAAAPAEAVSAKKQKVDKKAAKAAAVEVEVCFPLQRLVSFLRLRSCWPLNLLADLALRPRMGCDAAGDVLVPHRGDVVSHLCLS